MIIITLISYSDITLNSHLLISLSSAIFLNYFSVLFFLIFTGDKMIEWDENFRLFFTTKLANPHYSPEIMGKTMIINYGVTMDGLANQLLNVVVANERPDLEKQWADLVSEMGENALLLVTLEDTLLREVSSSQVRTEGTTLVISFLLINRYVTSISLKSSFLFHFNQIFTQGNILDNQELIATLENTKSMAVEIQGKLFQARQTKVECSDR